MEVPVAARQPRATHNAKAVVSTRALGGFGTLASLSRPPGASHPLL